MFRSAVCLVRMLVVVMMFLRAAQAQSPQEADPVAAYQAWLAQLPKDTPLSLSQAMGRYLMDFPGQPEPVRTAAFVAFLDFHDVVAAGVGGPLYEIYQRLYQSADQGHAADLWLAADPAAAGAGRCGLEPRRVFGRFCGFRMPVDRLLALFGPHVNEAARRYLALRQPELQTDFMVDALLLIPMKEAMERLTGWEIYLAAFPGGPFENDATLLRNEYLRLLLMDAVTSPANLKESKNDFRRFVNKHPDTESAKRILNYLQSSRESNRVQPALDETWVQQLLRDLPEIPKVEQALQLHYRIGP